MAIRAVVPTSQLLSSPPFSLTNSSQSSSPNSHQHSKFWRGIGRPRISMSFRSHAFCSTKISMEELEPSHAVKKKAAELSTELKGTSIFLVGMNCTMKTSLGKVLANALKYYYFDSESVVEQVTSDGSTTKYFPEGKDESFRESETEVLKQLSSMGRLVVSVGDGAVQSAANLAFLRYGISLWIDVPLEMLENEVLSAEASPPCLEISPNDAHFLEMENLCARYNEMKSGYGTADATVSLLKVASQLGYEDLYSVTPEDMAVQALKEIERLTRLKKMMEEAARPF